jgi:hypothetical protein
MATPLAGGAGPGAGEQKDQTAEAAAKVVQVFGKAGFARNLDEVLKVVDVPWYDMLASNVSKRWIIREREQLRKELAKWFAESEGELPSKVVLEVKENITYARLLERIGGEWDKDARKQFDEVLRQTDRVLSVLVIAQTTEGEQRWRWFCLVAFRKGQAKLVGVR